MNDQTSSPPRYEIFVAASDTGYPGSPFSDEQPRATVAWLVRHPDGSTTSGGTPLASSTPGYHASAQMELRGLMAALLTVPDHCRAHVFLSQEYLIPILNQGVEGRQANGYRKKDRKRLLSDADALRELDDALSNRGIELSAATPAKGSFEAHELGRCKDRAADDRREIGRKPGDRGT